MSPGEIRSTVGSVWATTPELELLRCIALGLASILERFDQMPGQAGDPSPVSPLKPWMPGVPATQAC